jgi:ferredoxin-NADP reductase
MCASSDWCLLACAGGPFGAPAEHLYDYEAVMIIGAGIGCTPMVGAIKDIVFTHLEDEVGTTHTCYQQCSICLALSAPQQTRYLCDAQIDIVGMVCVLAVVQ